MNPAHRKILNVSSNFFARSKSEEMKSSNLTTKRTTFKAQKSYMDIWKGSYKDSTVSLFAIMVHILCLKNQNLLKYFITF